VVNNANLISNVYFPKLIVPAAAVVVAFVDFLIAFPMPILLMFMVDADPADGIVAKTRVVGLENND